MVMMGAVGHSFVFFYKSKGFSTGATCKVRIVSSAGTIKVNDASMSEVSSTNAPGLYSYTYTPTAAGAYAVYMFENDFTAPVYLQTDELIVDAVTGAGSATTYTTATKVSSFLGLRDSAGARMVFTTSTIPALSEVEELIYGIQDQIDQFTHHAWRSTTVTDEVYTYAPPRDLSYGGRYRESRSVCLTHRKITTMSSVAGDKVEVWNGSSWVDFLATYTESRSSDFWMDYGKGILYFASQYPIISDHPVRLTYRYGDSTIPYDIQRAATLLVAADLVSGDEGHNLTVNSEGGIPLIDRIEAWRKEAWRILDARREVT